MDFGLSDDFKDSEFDLMHRTAGGQAYGGLSRHKLRHSATGQSGMLPGLLKCTPAHHKAVHFR